MTFGTGVRQVCIAMLVLGSALAVAIASNAEGGTTAVSSVSLVGRDAPTGSTATGGGAAGTTATGRTIDWTVLYRNTTGAAADIGVVGVIPAGPTYLPRSPRLPPGPTPRWPPNG